MPENTITKRITELLYEAHATVLREPQSRVMAMGAEGHKMRITLCTRGVGGYTCHLSAVLIDGGGSDVVLGTGTTSRTFHEVPDKLFVRVLQGYCAASCPDVATREALGLLVSR